MVLYAVVDVADAAGLHLWIGVGLGHALAIEVQPGKAALDVGEVAVALVGIEGHEAMEIGEGSLEVGVGFVSEAGGVVKGGPCRSVEARLGDDDGCGCGVDGDGVAVVAAVANDVVEEETKDDGEKDVVARAKLHRGLAAGLRGFFRSLSRGSPCNLFCFFLLSDASFYVLCDLETLGHGVTCSDVEMNSHRITLFYGVLSRSSARIKQLLRHSTPFDTTRRASLTHGMSLTG